MFARVAERKPRARCGFTLVELLVVMGVIAILMALLVPTLGSIRKQANVARAQAIIHGVSMALDAYKQAQYVYPPDKATGLNASLNKSSECLVYFLSGGSIWWNSSSPSSYPWRHLLFKDPTGDGTGRRAWTIYYEFKENMLIDDDGDKIPELIGPWQKRFIYNSGSSSDGNYNQFGAPKHHLKKFDLFNRGPDMTAGTDDDIENWDDSLSDNYASLGSSN